MRYTVSLYKYEKSILNILLVPSQPAATAIAKLQRTSKKNIVSDCPGN